MLPRRYTSFIFALLIIGPLSYAGEQLEDYLKRGKSLGHSCKQPSLSQKDIEAITPQHLKGKTFDGESALKQLNNISYQNIENYQKVVDPSVIAFLENVENTSPISAEEISIEKCLVENKIEEISLHHVLNVEVIQKAKICKTLRICNGHSSKEKTETPEHDKRHTRSRFAADSTIKTFSVKIKNKGLGHRNVMICEWIHVDNAPYCNSYTEKEIEISPERREEIDSWNMQNPELLTNLNCTLIATKTGPAETRMIEGNQIFRPFWTKTQTLQCLRKKSDSCGFLMKNNCILTSEKCLDQVGNQCLLRELTFKCQIKKEVMRNDFKIYGTDEKLWDTTYTPNNGFSDAATKLAVFNDIKRELQSSNAFDARSVSIFKGNKAMCSVSVTENLMYDCCTDMDGFATKMKVSKCTADELALVESRRKGLTHYIGSKKEQFLDLWTSREEQVYCVFSNKLSRVFQEAARKQLNIDWGTASKPDCRGLSQEEIQKLDFSKLDLSEAFELPKTPGCQEKIQKIEERLKQRMAM